MSTVWLKVWHVVLLSCGVCLGCWGRRGLSCGRDCSRWVPGALRRWCVTDAIVLQNLEGENRDAFDGWLQRKVLWRPRAFKVKCMEDTYNEETRLKYTLQACEELDYATDSTVRLRTSSIVWLPQSNQRHCSVAIGYATSAQVITPSQSWLFRGTVGHVYSPTGLFWFCRLVVRFVGVLLFRLQEGRPVAGRFRCAGTAVLWLCVRAMVPLARPPALDCMLARSPTSRPLASGC